MPKSRAKLAALERLRNLENLHRLMPTNRPIAVRRLWATLCYIFTP